MNAGRFIHQQLLQIKWPFLACLGLVIVLPLEEAAVNFKEGDGFYSMPMVAVTLAFVPLLAALLACVNVQADLDPKRDNFWRSKPVAAWQFIVGKFSVGLLPVFLLLICPLLFSWATTSSKVEVEVYRPGDYVLVFLLISLLFYSMSFFCNVLIRKTAQAWLIGVTVTVFVLFIGYIMAVSMTHIFVDYFEAVGTNDSGPATKAMLLLVLVTLLVCGSLLLGAIIAVQKHWQVRTNLRGLLWSGAGLVFILTLLFTRQMANIKVLDEITFAPQGDEKMGDRFLMIDNERVVASDSNAYRVITQHGRIELDVYSDLSPQRKRLQREFAFFPRDVNEGLRLHIQGLYENPYESRGEFLSQSHRTGNDTYTFTLKAFYRPGILVPDQSQTYQTRDYEHAYLCCDLQVGEDVEHLSLIDLSEYVKEAKWLRARLCLIDDKAVVLLNKTCLVVDVSDPKAMEVIERHPLRGHSLEWLGVSDLLPVESIDMRDRLRLSLEWGLLPSLVVEKPDGSFGYLLVDSEGISRYDVVEWGEKHIKCELRDTRPTTFLETLGGNRHYDERILHNGKLYTRTDNQIMVFDVRGPSIRKLGHFQRLSDSYQITDMDVLENGNILLLAQSEKGETDDLKTTHYLLLLENPQ